MLQRRRDENGAIHQTPQVRTCRGHRSFSVVFFQHGLRDFAAPLPLGRLIRNTRTDCRDGTRITLLAVHDSVPLEPTPRYPSYPKKRRRKRETRLGGTRALHQAKRASTNRHRLPRLELNVLPVRFHANGKLCRYCQLSSVRTNKKPSFVRCLIRTLRRTTDPNTS